MPIRIQRKRTKGWTMPVGAVSVTRPGKFGNPFRVGANLINGEMLMLSAEQAIEMYRAWLLERPKLQADIRRELHGKDLACFCPPDSPCHADILIELANR